MWIDVAIDCLVTIAKLTDFILLKPILTVEYVLYLSIINMIMLSVIQILTGLSSLHFQVAHK